MSATTPRTPSWDDCPSPDRWSELIAHRFEAERDLPKGWNRALVHLDDCAVCRRRAVELDPTLIFRRLAAPPSLDSGSADAGAEISSMQQAVAAMRRAERVERTDERSRHDTWTGGGRWVAAAVVALSTLTLGARLWQDGPWPTGLAGEGSLATGSLAQRPSLGAAPSLSLPVDPVVLNAVDEMPAIEPLGNPGSARVEDSLIWESEGTTLIWVTDSEELQGV